MNLLINFASRSRPDKFHKCMGNIRMAFAEVSYEVLLKIDRNDETVRQYLDRPYEDIILALGYSDSKIHAINRDIPAESWDIIINTSDDIEWKPQAGIEIINAYEPDMFLHFPEPYAESQADKKKRDSTCVVSIMDKLYYDRFGYIYHPSYNSLYCDNEATEVARLIGRYKFIPKVICEHLHFVNGKTKKDQQYNYNYKFMEVDRENFKRRKEMGFGL